MEEFRKLHKTPLSIWRNSGSLHNTGSDLNNQYKENRNTGLGQRHLVLLIGPPGARISLLGSPLRVSTRCPCFCKTLGLPLREARKQTHTDYLLFTDSSIPFLP